jgi:hypothetical protein
MENNWFHLKTICSAFRRQASGSHPARHGARGNRARMARYAAEMVSKVLRQADFAQYHSPGSAMGSILRFTFVGALGLLVLLPLWGGNAADSLIADSKRRAFLSDIGLSAGFGNGMITRLQEVRSEIHIQQCARRAQRYCVLGQCWKIASPRDCAGSAEAGAPLD